MPRRRGGGWLLLLVVLGFFRSLQYTALSSLGYADLAGRNISPGLEPRERDAAALAELRHRHQRDLAGRFRRRRGPSAQADFATAFLVMALFPLAALLWFARLSPGDGALMSGHRAAR